MVAQHEAGRIASAREWRMRAMEPRALFAPLAPTRTQAAWVSRDLSETSGNLRELRCSVGALSLLTVDGRERRWSLGLGEWWLLSSLP